MRYEQFVKFMADDCGMPMTEDGAIICSECAEPIYEEDFKDHDWTTCPVCEFDITEQKEKNNFKKGLTNSTPCGIISYK